MTEETALVATSQLTTLVAAATEAGDIDTLKDIAGVAAGLQKAAKRRGLGVAQENKAAELVLRAERGIGSLLPSKQDWHEAVRTHQQDMLVSLSELGFPQSTALQWKRLAALPDDEFESLLAAARGRVERIAKVDFYRAALAQDKVDPKSVARVKELLADDEAATITFAAFRRAVEALDMTQLPDEELAELAGLIKDLAAAYNDERSRR